MEFLLAMVSKEKRPRGVLRAALGIFSGGRGETPGKYGQGKEERLLLG